MRFGVLLHRSGMIVSWAAYYAMSWVVVVQKVVQTVREIVVDRRITASQQGNVLRVLLQERRHHHVRVLILLVPARAQET